MPTRVFVILDDSTISEARDSREEKRPRKRQRVDSEDEGLDEPRDFDNKPQLTTEGEALEPYKGDPEYYKDGPQQDDEHVICVGNTLFKVKDSALERCSELKSCVYDGKTTPKRYDCNNPLKLKNNDLTSDIFRAVVWAIHTPEAELEPRSHEDVERILNLAFGSKLFGLERVHQWCLDVLLRAAKDDVFMKSRSSATLTKLVEVADRYQQHDLLSTVAEQWKNRIVIDKDTASVPALQASDDKYRLTELRGIAYYYHLKDMLDNQTVQKDGLVTQLRADPKLNNGQVMRLLTGHWSLVSLWERIRLSPINLPRGDDCSENDHKSCSLMWSKRWTSAVGWRRILGYNSSDVLGLLDCLRDQLNNDDDLKEGVKLSCRLAGLNAIRDKREEVNKNLASHFVGCV